MMIGGRSYVGELVALIAVPAIVSIEGVPSEARRECARSTAHSAGSAAGSRCSFCSAPDPVAASCELVELLW
jgi:hypothetical protein